MRCEANPRKSSVRSEGNPLGGLELADALAECFGELVGGGRATEVGGADAALAKVLDDYESLANNKAKRAIRLCVSPVVYLGTNPVKAQSKVESVVLDDTDFRAIAARKNANGKPEMLLIVATKKAIPLYQAILKAAVPNFDAKVQQGQPSILTPGA